jgi:hypothetical protein
MKIYMGDAYGQCIHEVEVAETITGNYITTVTSPYFGPAGSFWQESVSVSKDRDKPIGYVRRYITKCMNEHMESMSDLNRNLKALK